MFLVTTAIHCRIRSYSCIAGNIMSPKRIAPGLSIAHYGTIVVNPNCQIGSFCRIHANTNLGVSAGYKEAPRLGNRCYIGPGAILFGDIILPAIQL
jgi:serine O-acetyltransferase